MESPQEALSILSDGLMERRPTTSKRCASNSSTFLWLKYIGSSYRIDPLHRLLAKGLGENKSLLMIRLPSAQIPHERRELILKALIEYRTIQTF
jgi:hypothetical protein